MLKNMRLAAKMALGFGVSIVIAAAMGCGQQSEHARRRQPVCRQPPDYRIERVEVAMSAMALDT